jgi:ADP-ribose pyrophosphatase YjhB (NUDIX family)
MKHKHNSIHADHRVQRDYPAKVKFCPLCGAAMESRILAPENVHRKVCTRCSFVLFPGPKLVAGCFVVDAGRVLLLRRGIEPAVGKWTFPGGYVDFGENSADAAVRETLEEVGMRITLGPLLGVFTDLTAPALTVVVYLAEPGKEPPSLSDEASEVRYFAPDEIPWHDLAFPTTAEALTAWVASTLGNKPLN